MVGIGVDDGRSHPKAGHQQPAGFFQQQIGHESPFSGFDYGDRLPAAIPFVVTDQLSAETAYPEEPLVVCGQGQGTGCVYPVLGNKLFSIPSAADNAYFVRENEP